MSNFTEEIKREIMQNGLTSDCCKTAFLSAFIRTSGSIIYRDGYCGFGIVTENERTAEYVNELFESVFGCSLSVAGAKTDLMSGRDKFTFDYVNSSSAEVLEKLGVIRRDSEGLKLNFGIDERIIEKDCCKTAYLNGAFLGGGSCTLPNEHTYSSTGYHYEIVFSNKVTAGDFCELLCDFEILARLVTRKESAVVYVKSKEIVSDLLGAMQTYKCLDKLNKVVEFKDKSNNDNRVNNCSVSNIDKAVKASVSQIKCIEVISRTIGLQALDKILFEVAEARLADPNASMQELADRLGITKSCINHRMRKIADIAAQLD